MKLKTEYDEMATAFISYKRGTEVVEKTLLQQFSRRGYAIWFDKWSIKAGEVWREAISKGINDADAFILCVTREACESDYIRDEVEQALNKIQAKKRAGNRNYSFIFPVVLEPFAKGELEPYLKKLAPDLDAYNATWLHDTEVWDTGLNKLFHDLREVGIDPSVDVDRNSDPQKRELHQRYWRRMRDVLGRQPLTDSSTPASAKISVEDIYVPVPTDLRLIYDISNYDIESWWLVQDSTLKTGLDYDRRPAAPKQVLISSESERSKSGWDFAGLDVRIQTRRQKLDELRTDQQYARFGRLDTATETIALKAEDAVSAVPRLVLVGDLGSGKTLFTRYFATTIASELLEPVAKSEANWWPHRDFNVVCFEMRLLAEYLDQHGWDTESLLRYVDVYLNNLSKMDLAAYGDILRWELENGTAILIIEDVDAVLVGRKRQITERSQQLHDLMTSFANTYKKTRMVLTMGTRALDYWRPTGMQVVRLLPLEKSAQLSVLKKYVETYNPDEVDELPEIATLLGKFDTKLAGNPRLISLMALLHEQPGLLYRRIVGLLLENENERLAEVFEAPVEKSKALALGFLSKFAFESLRTYPMPEPPGDELFNQFTLMLSNFTEDEDLDTDKVRVFLTNYSGIFVGSGESFRFAYDDFRQYLAAEYVLETDYLRDDKPDDDIQQILSELIEREPYAWSKVYTLVGDTIARQSSLLDFIDDLLPDTDKIPDELDPQAPEVHITWLAGKIAIDRNISALFKDGSTQGNSPDSKKIRRIREQFEAWLTLIVGTPGAPLLRHTGNTDVVRRAELGSLLGRIGDERRGVGIEAKKGVETPDIWWIEIPVGEVGVEHENAQHEKEKLNCLVEQFQISKYPITVEQYLTFVKAGGYDDEKYWEAGGWKIRNWGGDPHARWADSVKFPLNHPVTGVNWYEAMAFCQWMNEQFPDLGNVRLPTRLQWQRAARGFTDRIYPYEGEFDPLKANGRLTGIGRTTAVGLFDEPGEQYSRFGASDMSGNVYSWCLDEDENDQRALCGGSWKSYPGFMTIDACHYDLPENSSDYWGFRLVCDAG